MSAQSDKVVAACKKHWETHKNDCSGFAKAVATELGVALTGQANDIVDQIQASPWQTLASGQDAADKTDSALVVGGLKANPNGHVVVVVPGELNRGKYPVAYWGKLGAEGKQATTVNWAWDATDRDKVVYGWCIF
jgi:hypothetical protein